jgi:hypothetical protein
MVSETVPSAHRILRHVDFSNSALRLRGRSIKRKVFRGFPSAGPNCSFSPVRCVSAGAPAMAGVIEGRRELFEKKRAATR